MPRKRLNKSEPDPFTPAPRRRKQWLAVSYDIADDKRRLKVMKAIEGFGQRVQYSVFECEIKPEDVNRLQKRLEALIDEKVDDVRFYQLCENCLGKTVMLGKAKRHQYKEWEIA
ncbi:MAG: CRISPR-associated endonuclease Cas2 [Caldilineaceae bacterium]